MQRSEIYIKHVQIVRHTIHCSEAWPLFLYSRGITNAPAYPATEAALNIIITGATRQPELFFPWFTYIVSLTKDWFPFVTNYAIENTYKYSSWKSLSV